MKTNRIYRILAAVILISVVIILSLTKTSSSSALKPAGDNNSYQEGDTVYTSTERESITFILGEDEKGRKPYYALAFDYYKTDKFARTEYITDTCRSLLSVRDYLRDNPPGNGRPWGLVNLITHGNEWYGMSVSVAPGSKRSTTERISEFVKEGNFEPLPDDLIDDSTEIFLHGCGLGNDQGLLKIVAEAFGGDDKKPLVRAAKLKEYYSSVRNSDKILSSQLFYAQTWDVYYQFKDRPDDDVLKKELENKFPDEKIDWGAALGCSNPVAPGDLFHYTINVPVYYLVQYDSKDSIPDLSTETKKLKWISAQKGLVKLIAKSKIPIEKFKWTTKRIYVADKNNKNKPAVHITGWCTVLCVVKPMISVKNKASWDAKPLVLAKSDTTYFGVEK